MYNDNARSFMQRVYDSEINATIEWFWDAGFSIRLGNPQDDPVAEGNVGTWREVEAWLREQIMRLYPDSAFSREQRDAAARSAQNL
jgi:hypothetical protein